MERIMMPTGSRTRSQRLFVMAIASLLFGFGMSALAPPAQATDGVVKEMTFLLHSVNATETAKPLPGGGSTLTYFDTTLEFNDENVTLTASGTNIQFNFYIAPALAGPFTTSEYHFRIWSRFVSGASSEAQVMVQVLDRGTDASETLVDETNFGSVTFAATPELRDFAGLIDPAYTFPADHSIKVSFLINPGVGKTFEFYYDTAQVNSRVGFVGPDSMDVAGIGTFDSDRNPTISFDPLAVNQTMYIQASVTDPLGGYDVHWVNLTLTSPSGAVILDNVSMARVSGSPVDLASVYETAWNFSGQSTGPYAVLVWALDNNGHNHYFFFQNFDYGEYPDVETSAFYIGGLPHYAWIRVLDSLGLPLEEALVSLESGGNPVDSRTTDDRGMANLTAFAGPYDVRVEWADVLVAQAPLDLSGNISESDPYEVLAAVFYPDVRTIDAAGLALSNAAVYLTHVNGSVSVAPVFTDDQGVADLGRHPGGNLGATILWRGVEVASVVLSIGANSPPPIEIDAAVYYVTATVADSRDAILADAQVVLADSVYGLVADAQITDSSGQVVSRLPTGTYAIDVSWNGVVVSSGTTVLVDSNETVTILADVYYLTVAVLDSRSEPVPDARVIADSSAGRTFMTEVSDSNGLALLRVPAIDIVFEAEWLGVHVGSMAYTVTGDASVDFTVGVFTLDVTVVDAAGAVLPGAQIAIQGGDRVFALNVTDSAGELSVRLPVGEYVVRARFTAEYLYTHVDASSEVSVVLTDDLERTIQIGAYPPPVTSTVAFGFGLLAVGLAGGLVVTLFLLRRRGAPPTKPEAPPESGKGGEMK